MQDNVLYTGKNVHRFLGKTKVTEFTSLPDLNGTRFSQVFVQSNEIISVLNKETYFLYCKQHLLLMKLCKLTCYVYRCTYV